MVVIVVSDHGMAATSPERVARPGPLASSAEAAFVRYGGAIASIEPLPGRLLRIAVSAEDGDPARAAGVLTGPVR